MSKCLLKMVMLITLPKMPNLFSKNNEIVVKIERNFLNAFKEITALTA